MKFIIMLVLVFISACAGVQTNYDSMTGINQIHAYDNSALNTSSKLSQYQQCDKGKLGPENCKPIATYHSDTTGFIPSIGGQSLQGIALGIGLSENDDHSVGGSNIIDNSCKGNCGGGPK